MSELSTAPAADPTGPVSAPPAATGTTAPPPAESTGQAQAGGDTPTGPSADQAPPAEDSFFDPSKLPDDLKPAYKQMQAAYTKKTQELAKNRQKVEAYDAFAANPVQALQNLAAQYGFSLSKAEARQAMQEQSNEEWQPKTWEEVFQRAEERATSKILAQLQPIIGNVQRMQANSIENQLNSIDANWRVYEDDMRQNLQRHPTLVNDVGMLYRLSVPEEVYTSRAVQAALSKFESKARQATVGSKTEAPRAGAAPRNVNNFSEAVEEAKRMLAEQGR
jgi:hypothetical protein